MTMQCNCGLFSSLTNPNGIQKILDAGVIDCVYYHVLVCEKNSTTPKNVAAALMRLISPKLNHSAQELELIKELNKINR